MFTLNPNALAFEVSDRVYGSQHQGIVPKGAMDQLSYQCAKIMLGHPRHFTCKEIIHARHATFSQELLFVLSGAHYDSVHLNNTPVTSNQIYKACPGDVLTFGRVIKGFRLYLMATPLHHENASRIGLARGSYASWFEPPSREIRIFKGAEHTYLSDAEALMQSLWKILPHSDAMGLCLEGSSVHATRYDIISAAVSDGTVQLTPKGPLILMRHRQSTGGYPRIYQVAGVDIDTLAQMQPGASFRFTAISFEEALVLWERQREALKRFERSYM